MNSVHTTEGLLFRSYLTGYNLSFLHKCIKGHEELENVNFRRSSLSATNQEFERKLYYAKEKTEKAMELMHSSGCKIIAHFDKGYPSRLLAIKDFPPLLFVKGTLPTMPCAAIVGSRITSPLAEAKTNSIVKTFIQHQHGIVSGLALGIDSLAHKAALRYRGYTAAVLPAPLNTIFPGENEELARTILAGEGALISEQAPFMQPVGNPFVLRNRIQSALSDWVLPVEMCKDSGTRHTLSYGKKQNKKLVFCQPGSYECVHHLNSYEGIMLSIKKYSKKNNVFVISELSEISNLIKHTQLISQRTLFD